MNANGEKTKKSFQLRSFIAGLLAGAAIVLVGAAAGVGICYLVGQSQTHVSSHVHNVDDSDDDEEDPEPQPSEKDCPDGYELWENECEPEIVDKKPIIYLYPTVAMNISVRLGRPDMITHSYPQYMADWQVFADTDGSLTDLSTGRSLYSLYYESHNTVDFKVQEDGFVIKGSDTAKFLEEKLAILGLNEREAEEFIVYWLPVLEENDYNYIRFATKEELAENMPLEINPQPDTTIRVLMTYKALEAPIEVNEQQLETPVRSGFVAVEWGGTEIK